MFIGWEGRKKKGVESNTYAYVYTAHTRTWTHAHAHTWRGIMNVIIAVDSRFSSIQIEGQLSDHIRDEIYCNLMKMLWSYYMERTGQRGMIVARPLTNMCPSISLHAPHQMYITILLFAEIFSVTPS